MLRIGCVDPGQKYKDKATNICDMFMSQSITSSQLINFTISIRYDMSHPFIHFFQFLTPLHHHIFKEIQSLVIKDDLDSFMIQFKKFYAIQFIFIYLQLYLTFTMPQQSEIINSQTIDINQDVPFDVEHHSQSEKLSLSQKLFTPNSQREELDHRKTICGFLNNLGGIIFVGIDQNNDAKKHTVTGCYLNQYMFVRCGTPGFVASEIINIKDMDAKSSTISDVVSAGVIAHILFLGHSIFQGKKYNKVLTENRTCQFNFAKPKYRQLLNNVLNLLVLLLQKDPQKRISADSALSLPIFNELYETQRIPLQNLENTFNTEIKQNEDLEDNGGTMIDEKGRNNLGNFKVRRSTKEENLFLFQENSCTPPLFNQF